MDPVPRYGLTGHPLLMLLTPDTRLGSANIISLPAVQPGRAAQEQLLGTRALFRSHSNLQ